MQNGEFISSPHDTVVHFRPPEELKEFNKEARTSVRRDRVAAQLVSVFRDHGTVLEMQESYLENRRPKPIDEDFADKPLRLYLDSVSRYRLLSPEDEFDMFTQLDEDYSRIDDLSRTELLPFTPNPEQEDLFTRYVGTHQSIYMTNTRLVVSVAKKYFRSAATISHGPLDMVQDGNIGLIKAINRFDISEGFKFSTYATWWVEQQVQRGIADKSRTIRVPVHEGEKIRKVVRSKRALESKLARDPTSEELSELTGFEEEKVDFLLRIDEHPTSLNKPIGEDAGAELGDYTPDNRFVHDVSAFSDYEELTGLIDDTMLTLAELAVLGLRFGIDHERVVQAVETLTKSSGGTYNTETTNAIAKATGLSMARVLAVEKRAIAKLQESAGVV